MNWFTNFDEVKWKTVYVRHVPDFPAAINDFWG